MDSHMLQQQANVNEQETLLEEIIHRAGRLIILYPKYHCELNWIERFWSLAKTIARRECDYSFKSLRLNLDIFLDAVSPVNKIPTKIRRYMNRFWKYIYAYYEERNDGRKAYNSTALKLRRKHLKSHPKIGENN